MLYNFNIDKRHIYYTMHIINLVTNTILFSIDKEAYKNTIENILVSLLKTILFLLLFNTNITIYRKRNII